MSFRHLAVGGTVLTRWAHGAVQFETVRTWTPVPCSVRCQFRGNYIRTPSPLPVFLALAQSWTSSAPEALKQGAVSKSLVGNATAIKSFKLDHEA